MRGSAVGGDKGGIEWEGMPGELYKEEEEGEKGSGWGERRYGEVWVREYRGRSVVGCGGESYGREDMVGKEKLCC